MWQQTLHKSIQSNRQLEFIYNFTISFIHQQSPLIEQILFRELDSQFIYSFIDLRTKLAILTQQESSVSILWYFPLTKEKYIIKANYKIYKSDHQIALKYWESSVSKEERKTYHSLQPNMPTLEKDQSDDLNKFNAQDKDSISPNFAVLEIQPFEIEHTLYAMPQVIANSRTQFESLFKPYKTSKKYIHFQENGKWECKCVTI